MKNRYYILAVLLFISALGYSQSTWIVPIEEAENLSVHEFEEEIIREGQSIYNNSCMSCHGTPTMEDYSIMSPLPGDIASENFQLQKDGELFYKITKGRELMPGFEDALSAEEIWSLVAYMRSFHEGYEQAIPNLEGIEIPALQLALSYDENIDKLVIRVNDTNNVGLEEASVSAFVVSMFGKYPLGKATTNSYGLAYIDIDSKLPGDELGKLKLHVKAKKGYGSVKTTESLIVVEPTFKTSAIAGRHLWSTGKNAPIWLILIFAGTLISIWGAIFYILIGLRRIKKLH